MNKFLVFLFVLCAAGVVYAASGEYIVINASGSSVPIGESGGYQQVSGQTFIPTVGGVFKKFTIKFTETGNPNDRSIGFALFGDNNGRPSGLYKTGGFDVEIGQTSADLLMLENYYLEANSTYWLVFGISDQSTGNRYNLQSGTNTNYSGQYVYSNDGGHTWIKSNTEDMYLTITLENEGNVGDDLIIFGSDNEWTHQNDIVALLEDAVGYVNSLPDHITENEGIDYVPNETATTLFGYAKWLFSYNTAQELLGVSLAPMAVMLYYILGLVIILAIAWVTIKIVILILRFVQYIARWIIDLIPGT